MGWLYALGEHAQQNEAIMRGGAAGCGGKRVAIAKIPRSGEQRFSLHLPKRAAGGEPQRRQHAATCEPQG